MVSSFALAATVLSLAASTLAQGLTINSPTGITTCQPTSLVWTGGVAPYYLSIIPGGDPNGAVIENLGTQSGNTFSWLVDLTAGSNITFAIKDSTGAIAYSGASVIAAGSSQSCVTSKGATTAVGSAATATGAAAGTSAAAAGASKASTSPLAAAASASKAASTTSSAQTVVVSSLLAVLGLGASLVL